MPGPTGEEGLEGSILETAPADPRRAALLSRLEATVYCHGAIHVPADMDNGGEYRDWGNSKETSVVVSLGAPDGRRTLFVCSAAEDPRNERRQTPT